jgi:hypothetical protein
MGGALSEPIAQQRVAEAQGQEPDAGGEEDRVEHGSSLRNDNPGKVMASA